MSISSAEARERMMARLNGHPYQPPVISRETRMDQIIEQKVKEHFAAKASPGSTRKQVYRSDSPPEGSSVAARARMIDRIRERSSCNT